MGKNKLLFRIQFSNLILFFKIPDYYTLNLFFRTFFKSIFQTELQSTYSVSTEFLIPIIENAPKKIKINKLVDKDTKNEVSTNDSEVQINEIKI